MLLDVIAALVDIFAVVRAGTLPGCTMMTSGISAFRHFAEHFLARPPWDAGEFVRLPEAVCLPAPEATNATASLNLRRSFLKSVGVGRRRTTHSFIMRFPMIKRVAVPPATKRAMTGGGSFITTASPFVKAKTFLATVKLVELSLLVTTTPGRFASIELNREPSSFIAGLDYSLAPR
jgi:hypothetical protein